MGTIIRKVHPNTSSFLERQETKWNFIDLTGGV